MKKQSNLLLMSLALCLSMTGCQTKSSEVQEQDTQPITQTATLTETETAAETESTTEADIHAALTEPSDSPHRFPEATPLSEAYITYLHDALLPEYNEDGKPLTLPAGMKYLYTPYLPEGIAGALAEDLNGDGTEELLTVRLIDTMETDENFGRIIRLELYSQNAQGDIQLANYVDLAGFYTATMFLEGRVKVVTASNHQRYIVMQSGNGQNILALSAAVLRVDADCRFQVCELFIDPGYTSGTALHYTDSITPDALLNCQYSDLEEVYHSYPPSSDDPYEGYYALLNEKLSAYDITAIPIEDSVYVLSASDEITLFHVLGGYPVREEDRKACLSGYLPS